MEANVPVRINASAPKATRETCVQSVSTKASPSVLVVGASSWLYSIFLHYVSTNRLLSKYFRLIYFLDIEHTPDLRELWNQKHFFTKPPHGLLCTPRFYKTATCQLSNSSSVIEKGLIKCQYTATLKSNGSTLWEGCWGLPSFSRWFWWALRSAAPSAALCQGLSQTLQVGGGGDCPGALHTLRAKAQIYWESHSPCPDQPSWGAAGKVNMQLRLRMKCREVRCMRSLSYSCLRTRLWPVRHLCWAQQMPVQGRLARETLQ